MILALQIVALISMLTIIFIAVWSFIIANKAYSQMRYQNYLLEKLIHNVTLLKDNSKVVFDEAITKNDSDNLSSESINLNESNVNNATTSQSSETSFESDVDCSANI